MEKDTLQINEVADKLKAELSLKDDDEALKTGLDQIVLNETELKLFEGIKYYLPDEFWVEHGLSEYYYTDTHLAILQKCNPTAINNYLEALSKGIYKSSEKDPTIDKRKLTRSQYLWKMAENRIHLDDAEADKIMFDYIMLRLQSVKTCLDENNKVEWWKYIDIRPVEPEYYHNISRLFSCKPSLLLFHMIIEYSASLCITGNMATVTKLINWNRFLQSKTSSFMDEKKNEAVKLDQIEVQFNDHMEKSWRQFVELAIKTSPLENSDVKDEFGRVDYEYH